MRDPLKGVTLPINMLKIVLYLCDYWKETVSKVLLGVVYPQSLGLNLI